MKRLFNFLLALIVSSSAWASSAFNGELLVDEDKFSPDFLAAIGQSGY